MQKYAWWESGGIPLELYFASHVCGMSMKKRGCESASQPLGMKNYEKESRFLLAFLLRLRNQDFV